jgi:hypothetical protein
LQAPETSAAPWLREKTISPALRPRSLQVQPLSEGLAACEIASRRLALSFSHVLLAGLHRAEVEAALPVVTAARLT